MDSTIIVALISGFCTLIGTYAGIRKSTSLTNYRIQQLEEKVAKHNSVVERTYKLEVKMGDVESKVSKCEETAVSTSRLEEKMEVANHRIADLEHFQGELEEVKL